MKKKEKLILIISIIVGILLIVSVIVFLSIDSKTDAEKFKNEYEKLNDKESEDGKKYPSVNIDENNNIKYIGSEDIINILKNKESAVIYFGFSKCVYCRTAIQVLWDTASNTELDAIYYMDVLKHDDKYDELVNMLDKKFINDKEIYSPLVLFIYKGDIVSYNKGTLSIQQDPYEELSESQKKGLSEIYQYGINDVLKN